MIKAALINASDFLREDSLPGLGIGAIKAYLLQKQPKGLDIKIFRSRILDNIEKYKPDVLGISSENFNYPDAINLAKIVKEDLPNTTIILGGPHITALPKSLDPIFDIGVIGEGEETMLEVVSLFANKSKLKNKKLNSTQLKKIKGICFFDNKNKLIINPRRELIQDLDSLPHIDRSDFDDERYAYVYPSRGCLYACPYCTASKFWGFRKMRLFSAEYLVHEFKLLVKKGYKNIRIEDEMYCVSIDRLKKILFLVKSDPIFFCSKVTFEVILLPKIVNYELCKLLKAMNVKKIKIGLYSGSEKILQNNRNTNLKITKRALQILRKSNIDIDITFTLNSPYETVEDFYSTHRFIVDNKIEKFRLMINRPYPGSQNWSRAIKDRLINNNFNFRLLDYDQSIDQINQYNFINLTMENTKDLVDWAKNISSLNEKSILQKPFFLKIKNISMQKIQRKINIYRYHIGILSSLDFPKDILININNICNLNCSFCLVKASRKTRIKDRDTSLKNIQKIISDLAKHRTKVNISGGEPLLNKEIFAMIFALRKNNIKVNLSTNGYLVKKYFPEIIMSGLDQISLSLDHYNSDIHDEIRGTKGAFKNLMEGLLLFKKLKNETGEMIKVSINTVINKNNYMDLMDIYNFIERGDLASTWQLRHLTFNSKNNYQLQTDQVRNSSFPVKDIIGTINKGEYFSKEELRVLKNQLNKIRTMNRYFKTRLSISPDNIDVGKYYSDNVFERGNCRGPYEELTIWNDDVLTKCGYKLGGLNGKDDLYKIWHGKENSKFQEFIKNNRLPRCFRCIRGNFQ